MNRTETPNGVKSRRKNKPDDKVIFFFFGGGGLNKNFLVYPSAII